MTKTTNLKTCLILVAIWAALPLTSAGKIIYVDDDGPADFNNIQAAIDDTNNGDTIIVQPGIYVEDINFSGKNIVLASINPDDWNVVAATIIDGNNLDSVVTFAGTENATCVLSGFTIQNGYQDSDLIKGGGGICGGSETNHTHATIISNIITCNFAWDGGGLSRCGGLIEKNIITNNYARWWQGGGGLYQCNGFVRNNIITDNNAGGCESAGGLSYCDATIENNTITNNFTWGYGTLAYCHGTIRNCIIWKSSPQDDNVSADPLFADPNNGDYHLKSQAGRWDADERRWTIDDVTSLCIDAGDPASPIGLEPFPNGGIINMGAYGGTEQASKSYFGKPPCETIIAGDINGDCIVNLKDFAIMALHWLEEH